MRQSTTKVVNIRTVSNHEWTHDLLVITETEAVLHDEILIFLDFVLVHLTLLYLGKVPGDDVLPGRGHDGILLLPFTDIEPEGRMVNILRAYNEEKTDLAGVNEMLWFI